MGWKYRKHIDPIPMWTTPFCDVYRDIRNENGEITMSICGKVLFVFSDNPETKYKTSHAFIIKKFNQKVDPPQA